LMSLSSAAGEYHLARAQEAIRAGNVTEFIAHIDKAKRRAPPSFVDPDVQLAGFYIDVMKNADALFPAGEQRRMFDDTMALLAQAETMNPAWADIDYKRGLVLSVARPDIVPDGRMEAETHWRRALAKDPQHFKARIDLALAQTARGQPAEAYDLLAAGLTYPVTRDVAIEITTVMRKIEDVAVLQKAYLQKHDEEKRVTGP
jgi:hypothetical protein